MKEMMYGFFITALCLGLGTAQASSVTLPNTFTAGTPAKAAEVNANFSAVKTSVDDNASQIAALKAQIATLQSQLAAVTSSQVMALNPYLTVDTTSDPRGPLVQFKGVNVQVVNGMGFTDTANGLGNLIIGYDEQYSGIGVFCSIGTDSSGNPITNLTTCQNNGGTWGSSLKGGSHYLVVGSGNNYSQYGGIISGHYNTSINAYAEVLGGEDNTSSGVASSVSGGIANTASGLDSSVSGGNSNTASGPQSSVSGGGNNQATSTQSSISGGNYNTASGTQSSVSGGYNNTASGAASSVSGGSTHSATGLDNWAAGSYSASQ